jgi:hypothetical protein
MHQLLLVVDVFQNTTIPYLLAIVDPMESSQTNTYLLVVVDWGIP